MELNTLGELMRDETQSASPPWDRGEALVAEALRRGRRTVVRQRVAAAVTCCALVVAGVAVAGSLPGRSVEVAPAAPTTPTSVRPSAGSTSSPTPTPTATKVRPPTQREILSVLEAGLPSRYAVSQARLEADSLESGVSTSFVVTDQAGQAFVGGGVDSSVKGLTCDPKTCTREELAGGTVLVLRSPKGEKTGDGTWYYYERPDGGWIWLGQDNALDGGNRPVSRPELPLTDAEVRALLTSPGWDRLVARCAAAGDAC